MEALVFDEKIVQIEAIPFPVHKAFQWIDLTGITPVPEVGWAYDGSNFIAPPPIPLDDLKDIKTSEFFREGVRRVAIQVPDWDTLDTIKTVAGLWVSHLSTNATPPQIVAKDIYLYVRDNAIPRINAMTTEAELVTVDPTVDDPFGDGTLWPA